MLPGQVVDGRFVVEGVVGQGGMARVFRATDRTTGEVVALKVLLEEEAANVERFEREAEIMAALQHPGIVRYVAHGREESFPYIAMEWASGQSLDRRIQRQTLPIDGAVRLLRRLAEALAVAHERGIVHRDLKPGNVMLLEGDLERPKLIDFGIARLGGAAKELTQKGVLLGSMGYMAPEQARGAQNLDARADVFALGCLMLHALTGKRLFEGGDALAYLVRVVVEDAPRLRTMRPDAPPWLEALLARMLARAPAERPANAGALALEIERALEADLDETTTSATSLPGGALGAHERRVRCVLIVRLPEGPGAGSEGKTSLAEVAAGFGGAVDELLDGHLLVTFHGSGAATDEASRAAKCALAFADRVDGERAAIVAAESAGEAPAPSTIEPFLPMLSRAPRDAIAVDDVTAGLLGARFDVSGDEQGLFLLGERDVGEPARTLLGKPMPCVGRDMEFSAIQRIFEEAERERAPRAMIVTGEAGIGKSRLRHELLRWLGERGRPVEIWIGQGDPIAAGSSFGLLARALRRAANVMAGEPLEVARRKLRARIGRYLDPIRAASVAEFLGEAAGLPFEAEGRPALLAARRSATLLGDRIRRSFEELVVAECRAGTLLLVLEDLHFGDLPSLNLVDAALAQRLPLVVLALGRPELARTFPDLWAARGPLTISLAPLADGDSQRLARAALGPRAKSTVITQIVERAGGNAFFLEELVRAAARGRDQALPESVIAMVQGTLEELDPRARRALRAASVYGDVFTEGDVAALLGEETRDVAELFGELCARELLELREVSLTRHENLVEMYSFRHAYVREAAYAMLTDEDRVLGHKLAARRLTAAGEPDSMRLAEHLFRAGQLDKAITYFSRAAEQALLGGDLGKALSSAERGINCGALGDDLGRLLVIQAEAHRWRGENVEAMRKAEHAFTVLPRGTDAWCVAASLVTSCATTLGDPGTLEPVAAALSEVVSTPRTSPRPTQIAACARVAAAFYVLGRHELAESLHELAAGHEEARREPSTRARLHEADTLRAHTMGDAAGAVAAVEQVIQAFTEIGDVRSVALHRSNQAALLNAIGAYVEAEFAARAALEAGEAQGLSQIVSAAQQNLGFSLAHTGRLDEAQTLLSRSIRDALLQRNRRLEAGARIYLAIAALYARKLDIADAEACAAADALAGMPLHAYAQGVLAMVELLRGRTLEALHMAEKAISALAARGGAAEEGEGLVRLAFAESLAATGDTEGARRALSIAKRRIEERAALLTRPAHRRSFIELVPEHRRTLDLSAHMGV
ncbi:serine/threonine-protein kinase [Polyangium sp. 15x6]|uniref:serine/threonine-protein kinase n=1 Tax=Polyangium sp. 15x6 TaxID=3042687 RepID=UPI00249C7210|nr:serine/threonine-protein kinase [Polyangium sp. 15x6]MDI3288065.1 protein kinase [Polyangium sp. 15x6]